jgi:hypothetical protein
MKCAKVWVAVSALAVVAQPGVAPTKARAAERGGMTESSNDVSAFVPAFSAPAGSSLGRNASALFTIGMWRNLRQPPPPAPPGNGSIIWTGKVRTSEFPLAQLTLTGEAFPYGSGAVVVTRLTAVSPSGPHDKERQTWRITIDFSTGPISLETDVLPEREFEFRSVPLSGADLEQISSPALLDIHQGSSAGPVIGHAGGYLRAFDQKPSSAFVETSEGQKGFIALPRPQPNIAPVVSFSSAIIQMLRGDWSKSIILFSDAISSERLPTNVSVDANLMIAYCAEMLGQDGSRFTQRAFTESPTAPRVNKFRLIVLLSEIARALKAGDRPAAIGLLPSFDEAIRTTASVMDPDDRWVAQSRVLLSTLKQELKS